MDMLIDSNRIRKERETRAWSQEHLAEAAGLSLRTVQRVESSGNASYETARGLAAVFGVEVGALRVEAEVGRPDDAVPATQVVETMPPIPAVRERAPRRGGRWWAVAATLIAGVCGAFFAQTVRADQVMLDVNLALNEQSLSTSQLITAEGKDAEIRLEGRMRVIVVPTLAADGAVMLSLRVDEFSKSAQWVRVAEPKLVAADDDEATVQVTSPSGNVFRIGIRPHKLAAGS